MFDNQIVSPDMNEKNRLPILDSLNQPNPIPDAREA